ncbi:hypothetical protein Lfu02_77390 [Longispora fulva]|uniref:CubicO group peptidase (Beta-lactamase class C family) n=1 Tax=Longispora fulva TaxID=619741 RepID=A0A8J7GDY6_9ACTN|nr:serine hydrolase domain-containing protein [Longispora fulva]MBG6136145.1 CubicO group peptidase (beta-lactamase class C family) [Longispora fulva]GIG63367.1 hypothetical protein Lfu02_77390 [Longispora fulva]
MVETSEMGLLDFVALAADKLAVPGVAVGVWAGGQETFACHGVTSIANPLPVDPDTMFVLGSVAKSYTATALVCLAEQGRVDLDAPVRRYVPELAFPDGMAAVEITVAQLLNHTAGLDWRLGVDTGEGDDALAAFVAQMAELDLIAAPGARASYSQVGFNLAGRIVEKVTGLTFERAVAELLLAPLGLAHTGFFLNDAITKRFAVGHNADPEGTLTVVRQWKDTRANNPGGGVVSSAADLLAWARFHLGDGSGVLPDAALRRMREPTVELKGSTLGDAVGICWFIRDVVAVDDSAATVRTVGHGGSGNGQFAELLLVPERDFAVVVMSNAGPEHGIALNQAVVKWALEYYLGVVERVPEPLAFDAKRAGEVVGRYDNDLMTIAVVLAAAGDGMTIECRIKPEIRTASESELPPDLPPASFGLLPGDGDGYIVTSGGLNGQRGFFTRDDSGSIVGADLAGRFFGRVA